MKVGSSKFLDNALKHYQVELKEAKLPAALSSVMNTDNLPIEYAGIPDYISNIRKNLEKDAGGNLNQLQTICLDNIKGSKNQSQGHDPKHDVKILTQDEWWEAFYLNPAYLRMLELDKKMERERIEYMNRSIFGGINDYIAGKVGSVQE